MGWIVGWKSWTKFKRGNAAPTGFHSGVSAMASPPPIACRESVRQMPNDCHRAQNLFPKAHFLLAPKCQTMSLAGFSVRRLPVPLCRGLTQTVIGYRSVLCSRWVSLLPFLSYECLRTPGRANSSGQSAWLPGTAIVGSLGSGATGIADLCLARGVRGCNEDLRSRQP